MVEILAADTSIHSLKETEDRGMPLTVRRRSPENTPVASFRTHIGAGTVFLSCTAVVYTHSKYSQKHRAVVGLQRDATIQPTYQYVVLCVKGDSALT